ncbi:serine hydrolase domain-containing protein [Oceanobacillus damuensis]|uniref:serine hydrolase domain-containing protein n=1 Tax=Oceanobacillus damuensis TaxID=937928 RepID=UPI0012ED5328|nr:serine hydrolase domain-containing protein [Oceanobacillus damuensis]
MDKVLQEKMEKSHIPNATVSVVSDGKVIFEKGYGHANLEDQKMVDAEKTMFRMGSVSKLFTWTAVMQLVEQGSLDLKTDINEYLDFEIPSKLKGGGLREAEPITLFHLMTHTPGFEDYADSIFKLSADQLLPLREYVREYMPARVFPPGEVTAYSNYGTALAGYIVEQVSGLPFPEYVERNIYEPLEMKQSTFRQPLSEELSSNMVQAYRFVDGEYRKGDFEFVPGPAGGMSSTATDMAKFMIAYLQGGKNENGRILEERTVQQMFKQQFTQHPELDGMTLGFMEKTINNERVLFHGGSTTLFDTGVYLFPDKNVGLFISYSGSNYLTHTDIFQTFMEQYFPSVHTATPIQAEGAFNRSKEFAGEYHPNRKSFTTSESLVSLTTGIMIEVNENGDLLVTYAGVTNRFVETGEGIYLNTREGTTPDAYGEFRTIAFKEDPFGNIMLAVDGPMTYTKAPWYATSGFTFLSIIVPVLLFAGSLIFWSVASIVRRIKHKKIQHPKDAIIARSVAIAFGLFT